MPGSQIVGIVAFTRVTSRRAKVVVIAGGVGGMIVMVTGRRTCAVLVASPAGTIAIGKFRWSAIRVDIVSQGENGASNIVKKLCSCLVIFTTAIGNVACAHENRVRRLGLGSLRGRIRASHHQ